MAPKSLNVETIETELARLPELGLDELRRRWRDLYRHPAPKFFRRTLLIRGLAYQMQVEVYGGLSPATKRRLREIAEAVRNGTEETLRLAPQIKPGTRLIRRWQNTTHTVTVLDQGFEWNDARYKSLSAVAKAITGTNWNGFMFFGVKRRASKNKNAAGPRKEPHV